MFTSTKFANLSPSPSQPILGASLADGVATWMSHVPDRWLAMVYLIAAGLLIIGCVKIAIGMLGGGGFKSAFGKGKNYIIVAVILASLTTLLPWVAGFIDVAKDSGTSVVTGG